MVASIWGDNAPDLYNLLFVIHIMAIVATFGPLFAYNEFGRQIRKLPADVAAPLEKTPTIVTTRVCMPALAVAVLAGIGLVLDSGSGYDFSQAWVSAAFALAIVVGVVMWFILGPAQARIAATNELQNQDSDVRAKKAKSMIAMGTGTVHLCMVVLICLMVWKPGL